MRDRVPSRRLLSLRQPTVDLERDYSVRPPVLRTGADDGLLHDPAVTGDVYVDLVVSCRRRRLPGFLDDSEPAVEDDVPLEQRLAIDHFERDHPVGEGDSRDIAVPDLGT